MLRPVGDTAQPGDGAFEGSVRPVEARLTCRAVAAGRRKLSSARSVRLNGARSTLVFIFLGAATTFEAAFTSSPGGTVVGATCTPQEKWGSCKDHGA